MIPTANRASASVRPYKIILYAALVAAITGLAGCAPTPPSSAAASPDFGALVASEDRSEADRKTDLRRKPAQLLAFTGVRPGVKVLDLGAGGGYSTELLARAVGPQGVVYAQNTQAMIDRIIKTRFDERLQKPAMKNVVKVVRDYEDPVPPGVRDLDLVTLFFVYHGTAWLGVDRAGMNRAVFSALKPGGYYVIADHSAKAGAGTGAAESLHRIDESLVRREVEAAGFRYVAAGDFLRHPDDPREEKVFNAKTPVDEFVLKFVKP